LPQRRHGGETLATICPTKTRIIMKRFLYFLIAFFLFTNLNAQKIHKFTLDCNLKNDYSGYIYLEYENKKDSCLIINNHFYFQGIIQNEITSATFSIKNKDTNSPSLFLEPNKIVLEMSIEEKTFEDNLKVTYMKIHSARGSITTEKVIDYMAFAQQHYKDADILQKLYDRVNGIVVQNPANPLGCSLICGLSRDPKLDKIQLRNIYSKLNKTNQNPMLLRIIEKNLE
jgi:hypothetical protein